MTTIQDNPPHLQHEQIEPDRSPPLWRNRDYMLLWSGQIVSSVGGQISQLAFPLLVLALTHSPLQAGLVGALRALPFTLLTVPVGALVDRWDRKRVMILSDTGRAVALASVPIALALGRLTLPQLYLVTLVEGTLFTFFNSAESACLPRVVPPVQLPAAVAQNQIVDALATMLGPALSGILYGVGRAVPFLVDAISYAASILSLTLIKTEFQEERPVAVADLRAEIVEGVVWLWRRRLMRFIAFLTGGLMLSSIGYALIIIVLAQREHAAPLAIGLILASSGVGTVVGSFIAVPLQRRYGVGPTLILATWAWALTWPLYAVAPNGFVLGVANAIGFVTATLYMTVQYTYRLALIPDALQGRVNGVFRLISFGSPPLGLALAGLLLQTLGPNATIWLLFAPQLLLAIAATAHKGLRQAV